jgi:hypothetical protein
LSKAQLTFQEFINKIILPHEFLIFYGLRDRKIEQFYTNLIGNLLQHHTLLIIDLEHRFQPITAGNFRIFQPKELKEQIKLFYELEDYIHPKLDFIVVLGLTSFLADVSGTTSTDQIYNQRVLAFCLSILKEISSDVKVIVKHYEQGYARNRPQYTSIIDYYASDLFQIKIENSTFLLVNLLTDEKTIILY